MAFDLTLNVDLQVVGEYTARANLSTTPGGSTLTIGNRDTLPMVGYHSYVGVIFYENMYGLQNHTQLKHPITGEDEFQA